MFCCLPLGIVAVIFAAQVNGKVAAGDMAGALDASKKAKMFSYISIGLGLAGRVCYVIFWVIMGVGMEHAVICSPDSLRRTELTIASAPG